MTFFNFNVPIVASWFLWRLCFSCLKSCIFNLFHWRNHHVVLVYLAGKDILKNIVQCTTYVENVAMERFWIALTVPNLWRYENLMFQVFCSLEIYIKTMVKNIGWYLLFFLLYWDGIHCSYMVEFGFTLSSLILSDM